MDLKYTSLLKNRIRAEYIVKKTKDNLYFLNIGYSNF